MGRNKFKKLIALCTSFITTFSMVSFNSLAVLAEDINNDNELLLHYEFNEETGETGTVIKDSSGNENDALIKGNGAEIKSGVLTLPGGAANSNAAYVELPTGVFDNKNTLTISVWLKNETGAGNYSALHFGTSTTTQYWLMNPCNPSGYYKSVFTNGVNESQPWNSEAGISTGQKTDDNWAYYTTVITPYSESNNGSISAYYNGKLVGSDILTRNVSDFGEGLVSYIGRSSYSDIFYKGGVKDLKVYTKALSSEEIMEEYYSFVDEDIVYNAIKDDIAAVSFEDQVIAEDIILPTKGAVNNSHITWKSSNEEVISSEGKVYRDDKENKEVELTAIFSLAGKSLSETYNFTVLAENDQNDLDLLISKFNIYADHITEDINLPNSAGDGSIVKWKSSDENYLTSEGKIKRPTVGEGNKVVTLTAIVSYKGLEKEKDFTITILEEYYGYLLSYTTSDDVLGNSLHLAYSIEGKDYTALNSNTGICFAKNTSTSKNDNKNGIKSPYIFRKSDGSYGLIATNNDKYSYVYIFESNDLINFTNETKLVLNEENKTVLNPECKYNANTGEYTIYWTDGEKYYKNTTTDLENSSEPIEISYDNSIAQEINIPENAVVSNILNVTKNEYENVVSKLSNITNTSVNSFTNIEIEKNSEVILPEMATANYSDGSSAELPVVWNEEDIKNIDTSKAGSYLVKGTVTPHEYSNPFIEAKADPCITKGSDGYYYFTASYPMYGKNDSEGYSKVTLRKSETIDGLKDAEEITIWNCYESENISRYIWAPEIHEINGIWYIYFTGSISGSSVWSIRPQVLRCTGGNPMDPESWEEIGRMEASEGDNTSFTQFSLDMTYFENNGTSYVIWAEKGIASDLFMATVDKEQPWKLTSEAIRLSTPEYSWERINENVNEGPAVLIKNGKVFVCFSAAATGVEYCIGLLTANADADLMEINSWTKTPYPILTSADVPGEYGPGHNSFTVDENGNDVFVYHARSEECYNNECEYADEDPLYDPCRHARVKTVHWAADGTPVLKMTSEETLSIDNKFVEIEVVVKDDSTLSGEEDIIKDSNKNEDNYSKDEVEDDTTLKNDTTSNSSNNINSNNEKDKSNYGNIVKTGMEDSDVILALSLIILGVVILLKIRKNNKVINN